VGTTSVSARAGTGGLAEQRYRLDFKGLRVGHCQIFAHFSYFFLLLLITSHSRSLVTCTHTSPPSLFIQCPYPLHHDSCTCPEFLFLVSGFFFSHHHLASGCVLRYIQLASQFRNRAFMIMTHDVRVCKREEEPIITALSTVRVSSSSVGCVIDDALMPRTCLHVFGGLQGRKVCITK
jgi:hypothetical protein